MSARMPRLRHPRPELQNSAGDAARVFQRRRPWRRVACGQLAGCAVEDVIYVEGRPRWEEDVIYGGGRHLWRETGLYPVLL